MQATTGWKPACRSAITSVLPSTMQALPSREIDARALSRPYNTAPFVNSSDSAVFTYFDFSGSSSWSRRAWKPSTWPRAFASGNRSRRSK
jgi:hypothetical protein